MNKIRKAITGNHGYTLVELIVSFSILAIVSVMIALIIQTSSNTYGGISNDINLQYESQTAMGQIQDRVIDCSSFAAVTSDKGALYIFSQTDPTHYSAYKFAKSGTSNELLLYYKKNVPGSAEPSDPGIFGFTENQVLSSYVTGFTAEPLDDNVTGEEMTAVTVTIHYSLGSRSYIGTQTIAFRNHVKDISVYAH